MSFLKLNLAVLTFLGQNAESLNQTPAVAIFPDVINMPNPIFAFDANQPYVGLDFMTTHTQVNQTRYHAFKKEAASENDEFIRFSHSHLIALAKLGSTIVSSVQTAYQFGVKAMGLARKIFKREDVSVIKSMPEVATHAKRENAAGVTSKIIKKTKGFMPLHGNALKITEVACKTTQKTAEGRLEGERKKIESIYDTALKIKR